MACASIAVPDGVSKQASSTTPFHFLVQSELSQKPSRPERFDCHLGFDESPYRDFDIDAGIKHLQMLGVKYYMALTDASKAAANADSRLTKVGESGPWQVFEVADIDLVEPLANEPVVWDDGNEYPLAKVEISAFTHPFFTGTMKIIDTAGRVERFQKRYGERKRKGPEAAAPVEASESTDE